VKKTFSGEKTFKGVGNRRAATGAQQAPNEWAVKASSDVESEKAGRNR
jgi:hypothetical protein